jgi:anti-sigma factor RsiW
VNTESHHLLGAYLLGGLDAGDLQAFEAHLQECGQCRSELSVLEKVPVLLDALPVPDGRSGRSGPRARRRFRAAAA